jgi:hypothetical protein
MCLLGPTVCPEESFALVVQGGQCWLLQLEVLDVRALLVLARSTGDLYLCAHVSYGVVVVNCVDTRPEAKVPCMPCCQLSGPWLPGYAVVQRGCINRPAASGWQRCRRPRVV